MPSVSTEAIVVGVGVAAAATYLFRDQIFSKSKSSSVPTIPSKAGRDGSENPRDFVAKMISGVSDRKKWSNVIVKPLFVLTVWVFVCSEKATGDFLRFADGYR